MRFVLKDLAISVIDAKDGLLHGGGIGHDAGACGGQQSCSGPSECTAVTGHRGVVFEESLDCRILPELTGDPVYLAGLRRRLQERIAQVEALQRAAVAGGGPKTAHDAAMLEAKLKEALAELAASKPAAAAPGAG